MTAPGGIDTASGRRGSWRARKENTMLWTIVVILFILWLLGVVTNFVVGGLIHVLLVIAVVIVLYRLFTGRRAV
jgi:hypothetical protein